MPNKNNNTGHSFLAYFKRATSPLIALRLLLDKPMYGYELTQEMKRRSGGAFTYPCSIRCSTGWRSRGILRFHTARWWTAGAEATTQSPKQADLD